MQQDVFKYEQFHCLFTSVVGKKIYYLVFILGCLRWPWRNFPGDSVPNRFQSVKDFGYKNAQIC